MSKERNSSREDKKKPLKNAKEKRKDKQDKKRVGDAPPALIKK